MEPTQRQRDLVDDPVLGHQLFVHTTEAGASFVLRRRSSQMMMRVQGASSVFGMLEGINAVEEMTPEEIEKKIGAAGVLDLTEAILAESMVLPKLAMPGDQSEPGVAYSVRDLGDAAFELFSAIMGPADEVDPGVPTPDSSEAATEGS